MRAMKNIHIIITLLLIFFTCSCSKNDEENNDLRSSLIGSWAEKPSREQFIFTFNKDGSGIHESLNSKYPEYTHYYPFTYKIDSKTMTLTIHFDDKPQDKLSLYKIKVTENTLVMHLYEHGELADTFYLFKQ